MWTIGILLLGGLQAQSPVSNALSNLCKQMPGMPGCSIASLCASGKSLPAPFCTAESHLSDICIKDMPSMSDCKTFNTTCASQDCIALPNLPTSKIATQQIYSICHEMSMDGCNKCSIASPTSMYANCNLLETYSQLCLAMPEMVQCADWKSMCASTPSLSLCSNGADSDPPAMKMYFHTGIRDYILFQSAVPQSAGGYILAIILIFIFSALYEGYQVFYLRALDWIESLSSKGTSEPVSAQNRILAIAARTGIRIVGATWSYMLMLITMTFNVGLFMAVVFGLGVGAAVFGPYHTRFNALRAVELQSTELCC